MAKHERRNAPECWQDKRNWRWGILYICRDDPRTVVRSRLFFGWTWNFGHPRVFLTMASFILMVMGPALLAVGLGWPVWAVFVIAAVSAGLVVLRAARIANKTS